MTILNRDVVPFFAEMIESDTVTDAHRERAMMIADSIRRVMVEEVDRSWLETFVDHPAEAASLATGPNRKRPVVSDVDRVAGMMTMDQRTAMRAMLGALMEPPSFDRNQLRIELSRGRGLCHVAVTTRLDVGDFLFRSSYSPYLAVMRAVFSELTIDFDQPTLRLRFTYEQH